MSKLATLISTVAPTIASAFGGPFETLASSILSQIFSLNNDQINDQNMDIILSKFPDKLVELKTKELEFKNEIERINLQKETIYQQDRDSARDREKVLKDSTPRILAFIMISGYFIIQSYLLTHSVTSDMQNIVMRTLGTLDMGFGSALYYYFGSSSGSAAKEQLIARTIK